MTLKRIIFTGLVATAFALSLSGTVAEAQTRNCVIASNDDENGFRTDEISKCRIDTSSGETSFVFNGKSRQRTYDERQPLTTKHLAIAKYWLERAEKLRMPSGTNPVGMNLRSFLSEAARATHGVVLVRERKRGPALNLVFITDGVYRSIDFPGTDLKETPSGFLMTRG